MTVKYKSKISLFKGSCLFLIYFIGIYFCFDGHWIVFTILFLVNMFGFFDENQDKKSVFVISIIILFLILVNFLSYKNVNDYLNQREFPLIEGDFKIIEKKIIKSQESYSFNLKPIKNYDDSEIYSLDCSLFERNKIDCPRYNYGEVVHLKYIEIPPPSLMLKILNNKPIQVHYEVRYRDHIWSVDYFKKIRDDNYNHQKKFTLYFVFYMIIFMILKWRVFSDVLYKIRLKTTSINIIF